MELSERIIATLEKEGFTDIEEITALPNAVSPEITPDSAYVVYVTDGSLKMAIKGVTHELLPGQRYNISVHVPYSITAGPSGCNYILSQHQ